MGAAMLYGVRQSGMKIVLPEVVEVEVREAMVRSGDKHWRRARDAAEFAEKAVGKSPTWEFPEPEELRAAADQRWLQLSDLIVRVPLSLKLSRAAVQRVSERRPPSSTGKEEFRDAVVWEHCLVLANKLPVHLVTSDRDFFSGNDLAPDLADEAGQRRYGITVYRKSAELVKAVGADVQIDIDLIEAGLDSAIEKRLRGFGFSIHGLWNLTATTAFHTPDPSRVALSFKARSISSIVQPKQPSAFVSGQCLLDGDHVLDLELDNVRVTHADGRTERVVFGQPIRYPGPEPGWTPFEPRYRTGLLDLSYPDDPE